MKHSYGMNNLQNIKKCTPHVLAVFTFLLFSMGNVVGQIAYQIGFESGLDSWGNQTGSSINALVSTFPRTGTQAYVSKMSSAGASFNSAFKRDNIVVPSSTNVHIIAWIRAENPGTTVRIQDGTTASAASTAVTNTGYTRVTYSYANAADIDLDLRVYFRNATIADSIYIDDVIVYTSASATVDITDPTSASGAVGCATGLSWTNGSDAATGIQNNFIFKRTAGTNGSGDLVVNDQGQYGFVAGVTVLGNWTFVGSVGVATTYTAGTFTADEEYAIVHRDLAQNYSAPTYSIISICGPNTAPEFNDADDIFAFSLNENVANGTSVGTVAPVTDPEVPGTQTLTYSITAGNAAGKFTINSATGAITTNGAIDFETAPVVAAGPPIVNYALTVQVDDGFGGSDVATVNITINNIAEVANTAPEFDASPDTYAFSVNENVASGTSVGTSLTVTDPDLPGQVLTWSITGGTGAALFTINSTTGQITTSGAIDFETATSYGLNVQVSDGAGGTDNATVTIAVNNICEPTSTTLQMDAAPWLVHDGNDPMDWYSTVGTTTMGGNTVLSGSSGWRGTWATMAELGLSAGVYNMTLGWYDNNAETASEVYFQVGTKTAADDNPPSSAGSLDVNSHFIADNAVGAYTEAYSNVTLSATDTFFVYIYNDGSSNRVGLDYLTFTPINANSPEFTVNPDIFNFTVDEGVNLGTSVGTAGPAPDADLGSVITYSIQSGNTGGAFTINPATGAITTAGTIDDGVNDPYTLVVRATDNGSPCSNFDEATVNISVNNIIGNENAPTFANATRTILETAAISTAVTGGAVTATDPDGGSITYSIIGGNTGGAFAINATTGVISNATTLNYESIPSYALTVQACDNGSPSRCSQNTTTINVSDVNENPNAPVFTGTTFSVNEHSSMNTVVGTRTGTDADAGQTLSYSITGGTGVGRFAVNSATGQITVIGPLDFETITSYTLQVTATDNGQPNKSTAATMTINLNNIVEATPWEWDLYSSNTCDGSGNVTITSDLVSSSYYFMGWEVSPGGSTAGITDPSSDITTAADGTTYMAVIGTASPTNSITNGDFEMENNVIGFTSAYTYKAGLTEGGGNVVTGPGQFGLTQNAAVAQDYFEATADRSGAGGWYMYVDGATTTNVKVYQTTVNVTAGEQYLFSTWAANGHEDTPPIPVNARARLNFDIAGANIGNIDLDGTVGVWQQFFTTYTAPSTGTITISIENNNTNGSRNDFFLDDVDFRLLTVTDTAYITVPSCPLPVELMYFKAKKGKEENILKWTTSSEENNNYFVIERSDNGLDFYSIGIVQGNGTTENTVSYKFNDNQPLAGVNYYRLKQVDYNGAYTYSKIEVVQNDLSGAGLEIYPNPSEGEITIKLLASDQPYKLDLTDMEGRTVYTQSGDTVPSEVQISDLAKGMYIVRLYLESEIVVKKLVVY